MRKWVLTFFHNHISNFRWQCNKWVQRWNSQHTRDPGRQSKRQGRWLYLWWWSWSIFFKRYKYSWRGMTNGSIQILIYHLHYYLRICSIFLNTFYWFQVDHETPSETKFGVKTNIIYEWNRLSPSMLLTKENAGSDSITGGHPRNFSSKKEKELKPVIIFRSSTTPRPPQVSATDNFGLRVEDTTPFTTGKLFIRKMISS